MLFDQPLHQRDATIINGHSGDEPYTNACTGQHQLNVSKTCVTTLFCYAVGL